MTLWLKDISKPQNNQENKDFLELLKLCKRYKRPINVLEIHAGLGYFSFRLAQACSGTFSLWEDRNDCLKSLLTACHFNGYQNTVLLIEAISQETIKKLSQVEHFDIVLLMNPNHLLMQENSWEKNLKLVSLLGDYLFYKDAQHRLQILFQKKEVIQKAFWRKESVFITSNLEDKFYTKPYEPSISWPSGISLSTFFEFEGIYPSKQKIDKLYTHLSTHQENIFPWNTFLVEGAFKSVECSKDNFQLNTHLLFDRKDIYYQDLWLNGKCIYRGQRDCSKRFESIFECASKFQRPIKVLDLGANSGYFSFRLAESFAGTFVMIEPCVRVRKQFDFLFKRTTIDKQKIKLLTKPFSLQDLKELSQVEAFDIVLAMSVSHHFEEHFQDVFDTLVELGSFLFFEHPNPQEKPCYNLERIINEPISLSETLYQACCQTPPINKDSSVKRTLYLIKGKQKRLEKPFWDEKRGALTLHSNFEKSTGVYEKTSETISIPSTLHPKTYEKFNLF